ncbi:unnamed protein product [Paramecium primaurelia]|uniref:Rhodanese domain-containing protein n=1 Tax=Paramecium primaurelia TaxID=5886 RepID=A0A8S1P2F7_PARPR|nr:unnamed protein product [Paramecium primaurelia]
MIKIVQVCGGMRLFNQKLYKYSKSVQLKSSETFGEGFYSQQLFTSCLAEYAYYIESNKEAIIIDPLRDIQPYIDLAKERGATIKYVLLTHFHADFVAGHVSLKNQTGAQIIMGPNAEAPFINKIMKDGEMLNLGQIKVQALHTPGHTQESTCFLLHDKTGKKHSLFSGDTLFLGEVGRPDLAVKTDLSQYDLAIMLFKSLREKLMPLPDDVIVFPGHGQGSACGKNISSGYSCTMGNQKKNNYALQPMDYETFVGEVVRDLPKPPQYFFYNAGLNKNIFTSDLIEILKKSNRKLSPQDAKLKNTAQIIDSRNSISEGFIPGSINVPLQIPFAHWVGTLLPHNKEVIIVCEKGTEEQTIMRLSRIGYDNILGYMYFEDWQQAGENINKPTELEKQDFLKISQQGQGQIIDVRSMEEWRKGKLDNAKLFPLNELQSNVEKLNRDQQINIYCGTGQRAKIAHTLLVANGFKNVQYCKVGYDEIIKP